MKIEPIYSILMSIACTVMLSSPQLSSSKIVSKAGMGAGSAALEQALEINMGNYLRSQNLPGMNLRPIFIPPASQLKARPASLDIYIEDKASRLSESEKKRSYSDLLQRLRVNSGPLDVWIASELGLTSNGFRISQDITTPALCFNRKGIDQRRAYICSQCDGQPMIIMYADKKERVIQLYLATQEGELLSARFKTFNLNAPGHPIPLSEAEAGFKNALDKVLDGVLALEAAGHPIDAPIPAGQN